MHHFQHFDYIMRLTPFTFLKVKWLHSPIFMSQMDGSSDGSMCGDEGEICIGR